MRIAVIGWGSLIWCPGSLQISTRWYKSGPLLPIEFSRVSKDGRLTLVITKGAETVKTLWAFSSFDDIEKAASDLKKRENTSEKNIGKMIAESSDIQDENGSAIAEWLKEQQLDGAVWTALSSRNSDESTTAMDEKGAVDYIRHLCKEQMQKAEEYVRNTPEQIETVIRKRLRLEFGWNNNTLSSEFIEESN